MKTTKPVYIGESQDGRANMWRVECPKCGKVFIPPTTRLNEQVIDCPRERMCGATLIANYNLESVKVLPNTP